MWTRIKHQLTGEQGEERDQVPAWMLDSLLGVAVALVIAIVISANQGGKQDPDLLAYLFACGFGALMLVRRRFPVLVLVATMFLLSAYYILDYPAIGLAVPLAASLYSAAEFGHLTSAIVVSLLLIVASTYFRIQDGEAIAYLLGYELISTVTLMAAAIALGDGTRARAALRAQQEQTARLIAQEHALRAEQRVQAERVRMARDLHDVIGHSISVISIHSDVAREAIGRDDEQARQALAQIRATTSETMRELRATVKALRTPHSDVPPLEAASSNTPPLEAISSNTPPLEAADRSIASLRNLATLVERGRAGGLSVEVTSERDLSKLPPRVDSAAYRIVQESLTNTLRHAKATQVHIRVQVDEQTLRVEVVDNGSQPPAAPRGVTDNSVTGSGIAGMTERARLLGGTLTAGFRPGRGFAVEATIPLKDEP